ncbi:rhodanese-related sulfurtransferase [Pseudomonas oryzihabitans]|uniref:rhodanese-related sulfurtransferase n=1 Tax=Pseudomonas oryzihabitans TaxID=47885 RepID=UPI000EC69687|nr:rhodanese-related sulfurtransferase [Pseudomonas oryzihabitans]HAC69392.1 sulfurtransferase [Pseudomonas sp.]
MTVIRTPEDIRQALLAGAEVALLDVREEDTFAAGHPLWAANLPLSRLELEAWSRLPRRDVAITLYDNGEGLAERAAERLRALGYTDVALLDGGLEGWRASGGELFIDVNVPSKAFGELVEARRHTPSLPAEEVRALLDQGADLVILDARRFEEYQTMSIPGGVSVPGAELVLRVAELAPDPRTRVIVNCAGRTRSLIGAQSLINAGIPNPVAALRNGTIGWTLAGQDLEQGQRRRFGEVGADTRTTAAVRARQVADRAGVTRLAFAELNAWHADDSRTNYLIDVRTPEEYAAGHLPGARSTPGGQLVQETDHSAPVRGARLALVDDDGVRANMSASWLAQMGWAVAVVDDIPTSAMSATGPWQAPVPMPGPVERISVTRLQELLAEPGTLVVDVTASATYVQRHIPGAAWVLRADLPTQLPPAERYVCTCGSGQLAAFAAVDVQATTDRPVLLLEGGTAAWLAAGLPVEAGETRLLSIRRDRYRRPYEGTDAPREAMQAYLDWEFGLVEQLRRDGTSGFRVI